MKSESKELKKLLTQNGFTYVRTKGSHDIFKRGEDTVAVPMHLNKMIKRRIIKEMRLKDRDE